MSDLHTLGALYARLRLDSTAWCEIVLCHHHYVHIYVRRQKGPTTSLKCVAEMLVIETIFVSSENIFAHNICW